jgi:enoyl-CoA hydratase/carnithine racemase
MDHHDILACYEALARLAGEALAAAQSRDWENFARQQELEAAELAALKLYEQLPPYSSDVLKKQEALIRRILDNHRETHALLLPWRDEIGAQLQSASSSRMLARTYGT